MYKTIAITRRVLHLLYYFFYLALVTNMLLGLFGQPVLSLRWSAYLLGVLIISNILREYLTVGLPLFLIHIGLGVLAFFLAESRYVSIILSLMFIVIAMDGVLYMRANYTLKRVFDAPWPCFLIGMATIGLGSYFGNTELIRIGYIFPVIIIMIFLLAMYMEGLESYIQKTRRVSGAPLKQIVSVNSLIITAIMVITLTLMILGNLLHFDKALSDLLLALAVMIKFIVLVLLNILNLLLTLMGLSLPGNMTGTTTNYKYLSDTSLLSNIIQVILTTLILSLVALVLIKVFSWLIRLLLARNVKDSDLIENISSRKKDRLKVDKYTDSDKLVGNSPEIKARRIYKRKVQSFRRFFIPDRNATTKDILIMMNHSDGDNLPKEVDTLTDMYNDVRYGGVIPDSKFLRDMKKLK